MKIVQTRISVFVLFTFLMFISPSWGQSTSGVPKHLNPYREKIMESEVLPVDAKSLPKETPDLTSANYAPSEDSARQRLHFASFQMGYLLGGSGSSGPRRPRHQMGIEGEFGLRQLNGTSGWDIGPRVTFQFLSDQTAVYGGFSLHYFGTLGLVGAYTQMGYRSSYQSRGERFSPVIGVCWRLFKPMLEAQSQWTFSVATEMDIDKSGLGWMFAVLLGKDFQW